MEALEEFCHTIVFTGIRFSFQETIRDFPGFANGCDVKDLHNFEAHPLTDFMIDALFSACVRTGGGLDSALAILRDGKLSGPMAGSAQVSAACALMKWCSEDARVTFELIVGEVDDHERTLEALECLQSSYYIHFGVDPLTAWR